MSKVLVLYYSTYGHVETMAYAVAEGAREAGATADVKRVPETVPEEIARSSHFKLDQAAPVATIDELESYDAIVIGGGHNGLTNAAYLAKAGQRVLVLEQRHLVGGAAGREGHNDGDRLGRKGVRHHRAAGACHRSACQKADQLASVHELLASGWCARPGGSLAVVRGHVIREHRKPSWFESRWPDSKRAMLLRIEPFFMVCISFYS